MLKLTSRSEGLLWVESDPSADPWSEGPVLAAVPVAGPGAARTSARCHSTSEREERPVGSGQRRTHPMITGNRLRSLEN